VRGSVPARHRGLVPPGARTPGRGPAAPAALRHAAPPCHGARAAHPPKHRVLCAPARSCHIVSSQECHPAPWRSQRAQGGALGRRAAARRPRAVRNAGPKAGLFGGPVWSVCTGLDAGGGPGVRPCAPPPRGVQQPGGGARGRRAACLSGACRPGRQECSGPGSVGRAGRGAKSLGDAGRRAGAAPGGFQCRGADAQRFGDARARAPAHQPFRRAPLRRRDHRRRRRSPAAAIRPTCGAPRAPGEKRRRGRRRLQEHRQP
jgi:hypothetical protein